MSNLNTLTRRTSQVVKPANASNFLADVLKGLGAKEKYLQSKYFYNEAGDRFFQQIMQSEEYYLTRCEMEIFTKQTAGIACVFTERFNAFDIVELGAGDATKSIYLLKELYEQEVDFTYYPVDISANVIELLNEKLPAVLPGLRIKGLNGEYFEMLEKANELSGKKKVVLFLGSNIGNVPADKAVEFCSSLRKHLLPGDLVLIGFDLKKDPFKILAAYNDKKGITQNFNLNLLRRINEELDGNFDLNNFRHYPTYDPHTGACKSYLVSLTEQQVNIGNAVFSFKEGEVIFNEISQKYTIEQTDQLAISSGFNSLKHFYDSKHWFLDAVWEAV